MAKCVNNLGMLLLPPSLRKRFIKRKISFFSMYMALALCLIICLPVVLVHADTGIAKAETENEVHSRFAKRIISIQPEKGDHVFKVHIIVDGKLKDYHSFRIFKPHRFVIDLPDVRCFLRQKTLRVDNPLVKKIRLGTSHKDKVRIVFDLFPEDKLQYNVKVFSVGDLLIVVFGSGSASPTFENTRKVQQAQGVSTTKAASEFQSALPLSTTEQAEGEEGRAYFDLGVFAYEDGEYGDAEKHLIKALEFNLANPFYNHYLGKTYMKMERYKEAKNYLNVAWDVNQDISGLKYDMAILNYKMSNYTKAADIFSEIAREDPSNVLALYHAGINLYKQKRYEEAVGYFIDASERSPSIKANGYYYAGICYKKMGETERAVEKLEYVRDHADTESLRENALRWLQAIERQKKALCPYSIYLKIGYQYDDNVRVEPLDQDIYADEDDYVAVGYFSGRYSFVNKEDYKVGFGYSHYQTKHNELEQYDLIGSICNLYTKYRLNPITFSFSYLPTYYWLDSDRFLMRHELRPEVMWHVTKNLATRFSYSYYRNDYFQDDERDGHANEVFLNTYYSIGDRRGYLVGGIGYEDNSASHPDQYYGQLKAKLGISLKGPLGLIFNVMGRYYNKKYDNVNSLFGVEREDAKYYGSVSLSRKLFFEWLIISGEFSYTKNDSNIIDYEYKRQVTTLALTVIF